MDKIMTKLHKKSVYAIILLILAVFLFAYSFSDKVLLSSGKWHTVETQRNNWTNEVTELEIVFDLSLFGNGKITAIVDGEQETVEKFKYSIKDGRMTVTREDEITSFLYHVSGNVLAMEEDDFLGDDATLTRKGLSILPWILRIIAIIPVILIILLFKEKTILIPPSPTPTPTPTDTDNDRFKPAGDL